MNKRPVKSQVKSPKHNSTKIQTKSKHNKLDASKVTICVAFLALVGTVVSAVIGKLDVFVKAPASDVHNQQAAAIIAVQDHKYKEIVDFLDRRIKELKDQENKVSSLATMSDDEKALHAKVLRFLVDKHLELRAYIPAKHEEYKAAVRLGNFLLANAVKDDLNKAITERLPRVSATTLQLQELLARPDKDPGTVLLLRWLSEPIPPYSYVV